ncbi:hypothetical protein V2J09_006351 [Rumex salicifolius]
MGCHKECGLRGFEDNRVTLVKAFIGFVDIGINPVHPSFAFDNFPLHNNNNNNSQTTMSNFFGAFCVMGLQSCGVNSCWELRSTRSSEWHLVQGTSFSVSFILFISNIRANLKQVLPGNLCFFTHHLQELMCTTCISIHCYSH